MLNHRIAQLQELMKEANLPSLLITNFYNILYFSGFRPLSPEEREGYLLVTLSEVYLLTDGRYLNKELVEKCKSNNMQLLLIEREHPLVYHLQEILTKDKSGQLGFESEDLTYLEYSHLQEKLPEITLTQTIQLGMRLREIKDMEEIENIKKACEMGDNCLQEIKSLIRKSVTEKEIAFKIEFWIKEKGYDYSFYPIVACDKNSALPHYDTRAGDGRLTKNSIILIDMGVKYKDYCSDITRMFFVGTPTDEQRHAYDVLLNAQKKTFAYVKVGKKGKDIDTYCRSLIDTSLPMYSHSTGHGVGLEVHEFPKLSAVSNERLKENHIVTVEPGIYKEGQWGMRIEDLVVVKENGVDVLTKFPKEI
ncbi:MAG: Xaa-Pro peptidase family protein [bacterium]|nr:Xaa-Pro peptidase family protein [bacterium]